MLYALRLSFATAVCALGCVCDAQDREAKFSVSVQVVGDQAPLTKIVQSALTRELRKFRDIRVTGDVSRWEIICYVKDVKLTTVARTVTGHTLTFLILLRPDSET